jgi:hypothetical protein
MNFLRQAPADYLAVRRALGYRLARAEKLLAQFLAFVEHRGEEHLTIETALAWATAPAGADPNWMSRRLCDVRRFAIHLRAIDPATQLYCAMPLPKDQFSFFTSTRLMKTSSRLSPTRSCSPSATAL